MGILALSIMFVYFKMEQYYLVLPAIGIMIWTSLYLHATGYWDRINKKDGSDSFIRVNDNDESNPQFGSNYIQQFNDDQENLDQFVLDNQRLSKIENQLKLFQLEKIQEADNSELEISKRIAMRSFKHERISNI